MKKIDRSDAYDVSRLNAQQALEFQYSLLKDDGEWGLVDLLTFKSMFSTKAVFFSTSYNRWVRTEDFIRGTKDALELFKEVKISEVQIDCKNLSEEQIDSLVKVFEDNGVKKHIGSYDRNFVRKSNNFIMQTSFDGTHWFSNKDSKLKELSYEEFMEEFSPSFNEVLDLDKEIFETENKLKVLKQKKSEQEKVVVSIRQGDKITLKKTTKGQSLNLINNGWKVFSEDDLKDF